MNQKIAILNVLRKVRFKRLIALLLFFFITISVTSTAFSVIIIDTPIATEMPKEGYNDTTGMLFSEIKDDEPIINFSIEEQHENPVVILGGETIHIDYTNEGICYVKDFSFSSREDVMNSFTSYVQIGNIPIMSEEYLYNAMDRYINEVVEVKYIRNGKIYSDYKYIGDLQDYKEEINWESSGTGKICMYIPEISYALAFAHPLSLDTIQGIVYDAKATGIDEYAEYVNAEKGSEVIGVVQENGIYGVSIKYREDKIEKKQYIEIGRKEEVELGKAYIYTDFGEGLDFYEIVIESFSYMDITDCTYEDLAIYGVNYDDTEIGKERFYYNFIDDRMFEKGIFIGCKGMSGSPIIQNGKLIGFNGYAGEMNEAIYAETAYYDIMSKFREKQESEKNEESYQKEQEVKKDTKQNESSSKPIKVIASTKGVSLMLKGIGCKIDYLENTETDIKVGDVVIAIDGESLLCYPDLNKAIENHQKTENEKIRLTYIRDDKIFDTFIGKGITLGAYHYSYNWVSNSYISMIDPQTYRYAAKFNDEDLYNPSPFSGIAVETFYKVDNEEITYYSYGNVIGSITNNGKKGLYGYMEPFSYAEENLIEIAPKNEILSEKATIEIKLDEGSFLIIELELEKREDYLKLYLSNESYYNNLLNVTVRGAPIYQNGKLVGVYEGTVDEKSGYALYAIDVYNEMMGTIE